VSRNYSEQLSHAAHQHCRLTLADLFTKCSVSKIFYSINESVTFAKGPCSYRWSLAPYKSSLSSSRTVASLPNDLVWWIFSTCQLVACCCCPCVAGQSTGCWDDLGDASSFGNLIKSTDNMKAELPQRWPHDFPCIWVPWKFSTVPRLLIPKFLMGFCSDRAYDVRTKFEVRSFIHSWDNRGYSKNVGSSWICVRSLFSQICNGLLIGWTLWMYRRNLQSIA